MRIRCRNCETVFDYEKHDGYCPKCGSFNEKPVKPERRKKEKAWKREVSEELRKERLRRRWLIGIFAVLILIPIIGVPVFKYAGEQSYRKLRAQRVEAEEVAIGEAVTIGEYELTVLETEWHAIQTERQLLEVEYKLSSYQNDPGEMLKDTASIYLCADGEYIQPYVGVTALRGQLIVDDEYRNQIYEDEYTAFLDQETGSLALIAPKDAEELYLLIVVYDRNNDSSQSTPRVPVQKIIIPVQEVTAP